MKVRALESFMIRQKTKKNYGWGMEKKTTTNKKGVTGNARGTKFSKWKIWLTAMKGLY